MRIDAAIAPFEPIVLTEWECFEDDAELAGSSAEQIATALGVPLPLQKAHKAYLELLLKLKDERHEVA